MRPLLALLAAAAACLAAADRPLVEIATSKGAIRCALFADEAPTTVATFLGLADGTRAWKDPATGQMVQRPLYDGLTFHRVIAGFMIQGGDPLGTGEGGPGFTFPDEINAASLGLDQQFVVTGADLAITDFNPMCQYQAQQFADRFVIPRLKQQGLGPQTPPAQLEAAAKAMLPELKKITLRRFYEELGYRYDDRLPPSHRPVRGALAMANSGPATNGSQFFIDVADTPHLTGKHTVFGEVVAGMEVVDAIASVAVDARSKPVEPVVIRSVRRVDAAAATAGGAAPVASPAPAPAAAGDAAAKP